MRLRPPSISKYGINQSLSFLTVFLSQMAGENLANRAVNQLITIEEDEVELKPEALLTYSSILLDTEVQELSKRHFSSDAWLSVTSTLKALEGSEHYWINLL